MSVSLPDVVAIGWFAGIPGTETVKFGTYVRLTWQRAGIQIVKTEMLIAVTMTAVHIMICRENIRSGTMIRIRLMMICSSNCTCIHHHVTKKRILNKVER